MVFLSMLSSVASTRRRISIIAARHANRLEQSFSDEATASQWIQKTESRRRADRARRSTDSDPSDRTCRTVDLLRGVVNRNLVDTTAANVTHG